MRKTAAAHRVELDAALASFEGSPGWHEERKQAREVWVKAYSKALVECTRNKGDCENLHNEDLQCKHVADKVKAGVEREMQLWHDEDEALLRGQIKEMEAAELSEQAAE